MNAQQPLVDKNSETRGDNSPSFEAKQEVHDRHGTIGLIIACVTLGMFLMAVLFFQTVIDSKVAAAVAPANEVARTAAQNAKLAEDRANKMAAALEARGLIKLENH